MSPCGSLMWGRAERRMENILPQGSVGAGRSHRNRLLIIVSVVCDLFFGNLSYIFVRWFSHPFIFVFKILSSFFKIVRKKCRGLMTKSVCIKVSVEISLFGEIILTTMQCIKGLLLQGTNLQAKIKRQNYSSKHLFATLATNFPKI